MFILLRPVGLACQLSCSYCYYKAGHPVLHDSEGQRMQLSTVQEVLDGLARLPESFHTICLHGGEPTLIGKEWFKEFISLINKFNETSGDKRIDIAMQTNAVEIDEDWIELFKLGSVGVSVSIDGPEAIHDFARTDRKGNGTFHRVKSSVQMLEEAQLDPCAITVLTRQSMTIEPSQLYEFYADLGLREIDVAPYIETGASEKEKAARAVLEPSANLLTDYLNRLFDVWFYNMNSDHYVNIRSFEQTVGMLLGYTPTLCNRQGGFACGRTPCIMPDGTVFACDLETDHLDLRLGSLLSEKFDEIVNPDRLSSLNNHIKEAFEALGCYSCGLLGLCAFSCPRFAFSKEDCSSYCQFTRDFVSHVKSRLGEFSNTLFNEQLDFDWA